MFVETETAVSERYTRAARLKEDGLCCAVEYSPEYLQAIPANVLERDYGCGDPSRWVQAGETVLDLGCGAGKICFIVAQMVGPQGRVVGIDMNDEMLSLARHAAPVVAERIGYQNVEIRKGRIQDLGLDRDRLDAYLQRHPVCSEKGYREMQAFIAAQRQDCPLVASGSIDVVLSNCVLNLVDDAEKKLLFSEIYRVLSPGGRAVISDIVSDEAVPPHLKADPDLWSGCISGAFQEEAFLAAFKNAGFLGISLVSRATKPWRTIEGIEFRPATVVAYKGKEGECRDHLDAVVYRGPFSSVSDDDGHTFERGQRTAVCRKTFRILSRAPYQEHFYLISPLNEVAPEEAPLFQCSGPVGRRDARDMKGQNYCFTDEPRQACGCDNC